VRLRHGRCGRDDAGHHRQQQRQAAGEPEPIADLAAGDPGFEGRLRSLHQSRLRQLGEREAHDLFVGGQIRFRRDRGGQPRNRRVAVGVAPYARRRSIELVDTQRLLVEQQTVAVELLDDDVAPPRLRMHPAHSSPLGSVTGVGRP
jgi:hypothetical protein